MSAHHILLYLLNELTKSDKIRACRALHRFFATSLISSIKQKRYTFVFKHSLLPNIIQQRRWVTSSPNI